jgi:beta-mannanase
MIAVAKKLIRENVEIEIISKSTGLDIETIKELQEAEEAEETEEPEEDDSDSLTLFSSGSLAADGSINLGATGVWNGTNTASSPAVDIFTYQANPALRVTNPGFGGPPPAASRGSLTLASATGLGWDLSQNERWNTISFNFLLRMWNGYTMTVGYTMYEASGEVFAEGTRIITTLGGNNGGANPWNGELGANYVNAFASFNFPMDSGKTVDKIELRFTSSANAEADMPFYVHNMKLDYSVPPFDGKVDFNHYGNWDAVTSSSLDAPEAVVDKTSIPGKTALKISNAGFNRNGNKLTLTHENLSWDTSNLNQFRFNFIYPYRDPINFTTHFSVTGYNAAGQPVFVSFNSKLDNPGNAAAPADHLSQTVGIDILPSTSLVTSIKVTIEFFPSPFGADIPVYITDMEFVKVDVSGRFSFKNYVGWTAEPIGTGATGTPVADAPDSGLDGNRLIITTPGITAGGINVHRGVRVKSPKGLNLVLNDKWNKISFGIVLNDTTNRNNYVELRAYDVSGRRVIFDGVRVTTSLNNTPFTGQRLYNYDLFFEPKTSGDVVVDNFTLDFWLNNMNFDNDMHITDLVFDMGIIPGGAGLMSSLEPNTKINPEAINIPLSVKPVDDRATEGTRRLLALLHGVNDSDYMLVAAQNPTYSNAGGSAYTAANFPNRPPTSNTPATHDSDILYYNDFTIITGEYPALMCFDTLSFYGYEQAGASMPADRVRGSAHLAKQWADNGGIISLSCHAPNFGAIVDSFEIQPERYNFTSTGPNARNTNYNQPFGCNRNLAAGTMSRILPGGDANRAFTQYLDDIAEFALFLQDYDIPVLFRPFHETNGSWFWWGDAHCTPEGFKNVWRYTVEYMRDIKNVHNFLYVISPNGPFPDEETYAARYPGNEWVDVCGFDQYVDHAILSEHFATSIKVVSDFAKKNGKIAALTEYGYSGAGNTTNNKAVNQPTYHADVLKMLTEAANFSWMKPWTNTNANSYYYPFLTSPTRGGAFTMPASFIHDFINSPQTVFAEGHGLYTMTDDIISKGPYETAYFIAPASGTFITAGPVTAAASIKGIEGPFSIRLFAKGLNPQEIIKPAVLNAETGYYEATFDEAEIASVYGNEGGFEVLAKDNVICEIGVFFDAKYEMPTGDYFLYIDDFEGYYGNMVMLRNAWTHGSTENPGGSHSVSFSHEVTSGPDSRYSLAYEYTIGRAGNYLSITHSKAMNFANYDGIRFWAKGRRGEGLMVQLNGGSTHSQPYFEATVQLDNTGEGRFYFIPFTAFTHVQWAGGTATFDKTRNVSAISLFMNAPNNATFPHSGIVYIDDIMAFRHKVTGITLEETQLVMPESTTHALKAIITPDYASNKNITWSSNNTAVASVDADGLITARAPGTAVITATTVDGGFTAVCDVTVLFVPKSALNVLSPQNYDLNSGVLYFKAVVGETFLETNETVTRIEARILGKTYLLAYEEAVSAYEGRVDFYAENITNNQVVPVEVVMTTSTRVFTESLMIPYIYNGSVLTYFSSDPLVAAEQAKDLGNDGTWQAGLTGVNYTVQVINDVETGLMQCDFVATHPSENWQEIKPTLNVRNYNLRGIKSISFDVYVPYYSTTGGTNVSATNAQNSNWLLQGKIVLDSGPLGEREVPGFNNLALSNAAYTTVTGPAVVPARNNMAEGANTTWRRRTVNLDVSAYDMTGVEKITLGLVLSQGGSGNNARPTFNMPLYIGNIRFLSFPDSPRTQIYDYFDTYLNDSNWFNHLNPTTNATAEIGPAYAQFGTNGLKLTADSGGGSVTLNARSSFGGAALAWNNNTALSHFYFWVNPQSTGQQLTIGITGADGAVYTHTQALDNARIGNYHRVKIPFADFTNGSENMGAIAVRNGITKIEFALNNGTVLIDRIFAHKDTVEPVTGKTPLNIATFTRRGGTPIDRKATLETESLFYYLRNVMYDENRVLFGHQETNQVGVTFSGQGDFRNSDVKAGVGDYPAVFGYDSRTFIYGGNEGYKTDAANAIFAAKELGAIITLASHLGNMYTGSSSYNHGLTGGNNPFNDTDGVLVSGSPGNLRLVAHYELIANFLLLLQEEEVPVIFRPWHEVINTGGAFFWWHRANAEQYRNLWKWTVNFLTEKGVHNVLWCYSPNTSNAVNITALYTPGPNSFYPGDEYVDVFGYDTYTTNFTGNNNNFTNTLNIIYGFAHARQKILALTETGPNTTGAPPGANYYVDMLNGLMSPAHNARFVSFVLTWANHGMTNLFVPYPEFGNTPEHVSFDGFVQFYNDPRTVFASQTGGYYAYAHLATEPPVPDPKGELIAEWDFDNAIIGNLILGPIRASDGEMRRRADTVLLAQGMNLAKRVHNPRNTFLGASSWKMNSFIAMNANIKGYDDVALTYNWMLLGTNLPEKIRVQYSINSGWSWVDINDGGVLDLDAATAGVVYTHTVYLPARAVTADNIRIRWVNDRGSVIKGNGNGTFALKDVRLINGLMLP